MMKNVILILLAVLSFAGVSAQNISQDNVPAVVLNAFQIKVPNATDIHWRLVNGNYQVKCEVYKKENQVTINHKGEVIKHQQDLYISEIPLPVMETIRSRVPLFDVGDADKIEEGGKIIYEINFKTGGKRSYFWTDDKGNLLKYRQELKESEIPASIMSLIASKFGRLDNIDRAKFFEENGKKYYIVAGDIHDRAHTFLFDDRYNMLEHYQDLKDSEIPAPVLAKIHNSYAAYDLRDADMADKRGIVTYTLRLKKSDNEVRVTFFPDGRILSVK